MAIYNEILAGRFSRAIQRVFSMKGGVPSKQVSGELSPNIQTDDFLEMENRLLIGLRSFSYAKFLAAGGAGNIGQVSLRNPLGSGAIAVVEKLTVADQTGAAGGSAYTIRGGPIPNSTDNTSVDSGNTAIRDARLGPTSGAIITSFGTPAAVLGTRIIAQVQCQTNQSLDIILDADHEMVLFPGDAIRANLNSANAAILVTFFWRERVLEESEALLVG